MDPDTKLDPAQIGNTVSALKEKQLATPVAAIPESNNESSSIESSIEEDVIEKVPLRASSVRTVPVAVPAQADKSAVLEVKTPDEPSSPCANSPRPEPECDYWASLGECTVNPELMMQKCCKACTKLIRHNEAKQRACIDEEPECGYWAGLGECESNTAIMSQKCCKTCSEVMDINFGLPD